MRILWGHGQGPLSQPTSSVFVSIMQPFLAEVLSS